MALAQMPIHIPLVDASGKMHRIWVRYFNDLSEFIGANETDASSSNVLANIQTLTSNVTELQRETDALSQGRTL